MMDPRVAAGFLKGVPNNIATPARDIFVDTTGQFVNYPSGYISHPSLIGTLRRYPEYINGRSFGYPSYPHPGEFSYIVGNFPAPDNYPGMSYGLQ